MPFKLAYCAGHHLGNANGIPASLIPGGVREWTLNDRIADALVEAAAQYQDVELLRTDDPTGNRLIDIPERCAAANRWGADLYLDIHHNAGINGGSGGGIVLFSYPGSVKGKQYRDAIYRSLIAAGAPAGNRSEPLQEKALDSLRYSTMPAVLAEYGFMDSQTDVPVITDEGYPRLAAAATMAGIAAVAGLKKKPAVRYRVQLGAFAERESALSLVKALNAAGFPEAFITEITL